MPLHDHDHDSPPDRPEVPVRDDVRSAPTLKRRDLLTLMGASLALGAGAGCVRKPPRKIVSRTSAPEFQKPGEALHYASSWTDGPFPFGLLIKTVDGRPIKIEGNPDHPVNQGSSSAQMQASLLSLYDPQRLQQPRGASSWTEADKRIKAALKDARSIALMTRASIGPTEQFLVAELMARYPSCQHLVYEPLADTNRRSAWRKLFGRDGEWLPRFDKASVILSIADDFLGSDSLSLEAIRHFSRGRKIDDANPAGATMSRLYVAESALSLTGTNADRRLRISPAMARPLAEALLAALDGGDIAAFAQEHSLDVDLLKALVADLRAAKDKALVVASGQLPEAVHAAVALLNERLGALGHTLVFNPYPALQAATEPARIAKTLEAGVDVLICLGVNPVYDWPGGGFDKLLSRAKLSVAHALYPNETAAACSLALPSHHNLESWNDAHPRSGVWSLCQPVIRPLFNSRQEASSLAIWAGSSPDIAELIEQRWRQSQLAGAAHPTLAWQDALRSGVLEKAVSAPSVSLSREAATALLTVERGKTNAALSLVLTAHHGAYDGRFGANSWLLELPDPVTKLVWDNALQLSPKTARELGVASEDMLSVTVAGRSVTAPVQVLPGTADGVAALSLGMGRKVGDNSSAGVNAYPLAVGGKSIQTELTTTTAAGTHKLVSTQKTFSMHDRPIALAATLEQYRSDAKVVQKKRHRPAKLRLYEPYDYSKQPNKWEMAIDLNRCVGCNACVVACQAENNIPVVGKEECANGREMHWLRIDQYRDGDPSDPAVHHQPILCQQCDNAPCENVCPVAATVHSPEGLNDMVYNRCIGTRYCANNCPYKVRRFNFFDFQERNSTGPERSLMHNPNVTVRSIGVMEKCTFCVQRINGAKFDAANKDEPIADGAVVTACEQACPAQAIVFGSTNTPRDQIPSRVSELKRSARRYQVLEETLVEPNVSYLAKLRNPPEHTSQPPSDHKTSLLMPTEPVGRAKQ